MNEDWDQENDLDLEPEPTPASDTSSALPKGVDLASLTESEQQEAIAHIMRMRYAPNNQGSAAPPSTPQAPQEPSLPAWMEPYADVIKQDIVRSLGPLMDPILKREATQELIDGMSSEEAKVAKAHLSGMDAQLIHAMANTPALKQLFQNGMKYLGTQQSKRPAPGETRSQGRAEPSETDREKRYADAVEREYGFRPSREAIRASLAEADKKK